MKPTIRHMPHTQTFHNALAHEIDAPHADHIIEQTKARYAELYAERMQYPERALQKHLDESILPGLALYQALQAQGYDTEPALVLVERAFEAWGAVGQKGMSKLGRLPFFYQLLRLLTRWVMRGSFPPQGWDTEWVEVSSQVVAFNLHRCFYLDVLTEYGAPELTPFYCRLDDLIYEEVSPYMRWGRTKTLGRGDDCCDFRFVRIRR